MAREGVAGAAESFWIDRRLLVFWRERRERHRSCLACAAGPSDVDDDRDDPGLQRAAALEALEPLKDAQPCVLEDLLGHRACLHIRARDGEHQSGVAVDERLERGLVALAQALDELGLVADDRHRTQGYLRRRPYPLRRRLRQAATRRLSAHAPPCARRNFSLRL